MRLGLPWRSFPSPPTPPFASQAPAPKRRLNSSNALEHVATRLADASPCTVLDLGPPISANLAFYARYGAKITIADFYRFYRPLRGTSLERASTRAALLNELVPHDASTRFDLVMAWDLLNYLCLDEIAWLIDGMSDLCSPGALMFAIVTGSGDMPETPSNYSLVDMQTLISEPRTSRVRPSPNHSEHALASVTPRLTVERRFQLRNATAELLFSFR